MMLSKGVFPVDDRCEICGARLGDEVYIQEFADGSLARLCPECAAGAALDDETYSLRPMNQPTEIPPGSERDPSSSDCGAAEQESFHWPDGSTVSPPEADPLEKTRELLDPVNDLIALQKEMQGALERLAACLERFALEMLTEQQGKSAVESRLRTLEQELIKTRALLEQTDLGMGALTPIASAPQTPAASTFSALDTQQTATPITEAALPHDAALPQGYAETQVGDASFGADSPTVVMPAIPGASGDDVVQTKAGARSGEVIEPLDAAGGTMGTALSPQSEPPAEARGESAGFTLEEVQLTQRYYNESAFIKRIADITANLGRPRANLTRVPGAIPRAIVTITWDIVWYQYLIDLRRDLPPGHQRVVLHREGMDLEELAAYFKEKNAVVNDDGRLDASELEVRLLSDPSALITEMTPEEARLLEDATEEIWDQRSAPEFRWDD